MCLPWELLLPARATSLLGHLYEVQAERFRPGNMLLLIRNEAQQL